MKELKTLNDLLNHEVQALYNAEKLQLAALERMSKKVTNLELKVLLQQHLAESATHMNRLEEVAKILNIDPQGDGNPAIKGLIAEGEKVLHKEATTETLDAAIIAGIQKIEHYEISGYGTATHLASELGLLPVWDLLEKTLQEEYATDSKLNQLAKSKINPKAEKISA